MVPFGVAGCIAGFSPCATLHFDTCGEGEAIVVVDVDFQMSCFIFGLRGANIVWYVECRDFQ